ncbi:hypothetical protein F7Q99_34110 [Streptomyces kaniharaensis]|uniref:Cold-shock protein n=1 Tax=Streptomyces kaniharaensis TaxID=212423 RepID=A0A6N7L2Z7_9ACTN|nr:hypothetical protein [Streptomyces kaniharaensis]MQS17089.1 hypothetical protein [Streptomyces kaniharaensis]
MHEGKVEVWYSEAGQGCIRDDAGDGLDFSSDDLLNPDEALTLHRGDRVRYRVEEGMHATAVEQA